MTKRRIRRGTRQTRAILSSSGVDPTVVYIIEDDSDLREALAWSLRGYGYRVVDMTHDAVDSVGSWPHVNADSGRFSFADLIITDQRLLCRTGLELLSAVRRVDWVTQMILISDATNDEVKAEATRLGVAAVLAKPFTLEEFVDTVQHIAPAA